MKYRRIFILFAASLVTFWFAFGPVGKWLSDVWSGLFNFWSPPGLVGALWAVFTMLLGLLPQLVMLFIFFYFVEKYNRKFVRIVMGFGCGTVAACTLSAIPDERERKRTAILLSFIPCSAQMPIVLMLFGNVLDLSFLVIFLLYAGTLGIGYLVSNLTVPGKKVPQAAKVPLDPIYVSRFSLADMGKSVVTNVVQFFHRISGTVLVAAGVLYFISNYSFGLQQVPTNQSMLIEICSVLEPLFIPLGFNAAIIATLVFGIMGKEMAAAAIVMLAPFDTTASIITFVIFFMLYPPCIANIKALSVNTSRRTAALAFLLNITVAYVAAFAFYVAYLVCVC